MSEKYIRENENSFQIIRNSKSYGKFESLEDAIFIRDELIKKDWDLNSIEEIHKIDGIYLIVAIIDEKIHILAKCRKRPSKKAIDKLIKKRIRNPNKSRYGLNISRIFDTYVIKKRIAGDDYVFGYYDNLHDAEFVRNFLLDNMWNVEEFSQIQFDEETDTYKVIEVIDDRAYVLGTFKSKDEIDLDRVHEDFLTRISKHKYGLAASPHLDELTGKIPELEGRFGVRARDDVWSFENTENPLNDMIFNLTAFQKSVYDAIGDKSTFDEIAQSLIRFKSKNFEGKIQRNLEDLIGMGLVVRDGENFKKTK